ncbi:hypothetical protein NLX83_18500 [Allokutzneria sp. A3M-2-11 16]|uniref:hypothetical protein n=1 Tax=Allokutzneria sp. A3M-2-11 16 TaxID=2962043 RepID=UPI0020B7E2C2|nr:hypothetical protein [Allokutzneria sp. A3M-2-11 16]MCP3801255.1 hypothetical protein [Allokutzneria sp. A3M-2-11 16]
MTWLAWRQQRRAQFGVTEALRHAGMPPGIGTERYQRLREAGMEVVRLYQPGNRFWWLRNKLA